MAAIDCRPRCPCRRRRRCPPDDDVFHRFSMWLSRDPRDPFPRITLGISPRCYLHDDRFSFVRMFVLESQHSVRTPERRKSSERRSINHRRRYVLLFPTRIYGSETSGSRLF